MNTSQLSENDRELIGLLRANPVASIGYLIEGMGVTATAVRQRLSRLMALGLVHRSHSVEGRGRPSHRYELTEKGRKSLANNLGDLAVVLWKEVQRIADAETRQQVISGVVERLAMQYETEVQGSTTAQRMESITRMFADRDIPVTFEQRNGLPIIKVSGCPYPSLVEDNRDICEMEQRLLAKMIGHPMTLCECQHDGASCCSFQSEASKN